jgi:hypothetical protein
MFVEHQRTEKNATPLSYFIILLCLFLVYLKTLSIASIIRLLVNDVQGRSVYVNRASPANTL